MGVIDGIEGLLRFVHCASWMIKIHAASFGTRSEVVGNLRPGSEKRMVLMKIYSSEALIVYLNTILN